MKTKNSACKFCRRHFHPKIARETACLTCRSLQSVQASSASALGNVYGRRGDALQRAMLAPARRSEEPLPKGHLVPFRKSTLWFLYILCGFAKSALQELTGWQRAEIDYGLRKWQVHNLSVANTIADDYHWRITASYYLEVYPWPGTFRDRLQFEKLMREWAREKLDDGTISWPLIDALSAVHDVLFERHLRAPARMETEEPKKEPRRMKLFLDA